MTTARTALLGLALATSILAPILAAQDSPAQDSSAQDETVERILELRRQIDELIATLSPEARERLARRTAESSDDEGAPGSVPSGSGPSGSEPETSDSEAAARAATLAPQPEAPPPEPQAPARRRRARPSCNFLELLDENRDGRITALDRYWRHLYVWSDKNGDRQVQDDEAESVYARNIREISTDLTTFVRKKGTLGDIRVDDYLRLDVRADGFGGGDDGVLAVDASRLKRGAGPELQSSGGEALEGLQPFQEGLRFLAAGGDVVELTCP